MMETRQPPGFLQKISLVAVTASWWVTRIVIALNVLMGLQAERASRSYVRVCSTGTAQVQ